jgi:pimeloyl-ACP methyl ester carboxylesterase
MDVHVRDVGRGPPIVVLHGGWGYEIYPFDHAIGAIDRRFVIPDRTGYGKSPRIAELPPRFHTAAAIETEAVLDAMGISGAVLWGHSDGAVIAAILALRDPRRYAGIVLEALHVDRVKPRSRAFFTRMAVDPDGFGPRIAEKLAADHGADYWRDIIRAGGRAWLAIARAPEVDFFDGRLRELAVPTLVVHGTDDPRTEPGELDVLRDLAAVTVEMIPGGQHSPHSERATAAVVTERVARFVRGL